RTLADPLALAMRAGYAFVPLGFLLIGASTWFAGVPESAGIEAWTGGAIGLMTLATMTRAALGHAGQELKPGPATLTIYMCVLAAALLRIVAAFTGSMIVLEYAGMAWIAGFVCFVLLYGPLLGGHKPA
ncbi:MAG TPA: NnrS family protein, partial [Pseudolabrys sp.]